MLTNDLKRYLIKMIVFGIGIVFVGGWILHAKNQLHLFFNLADLDSLNSTAVALVLSAVAFTLGSIILYGMHYLIRALFNITAEDNEFELFEYKQSYLFLVLLGNNLINRSRLEDESIFIGSLILIWVFIPGNILFNNYTGVALQSSERMSLLYSDYHLVPSDENQYGNYAHEIVSSQRFMFKAAGQFEGYSSVYDERPNFGDYILSIPVYLMESIIFTLLYWGVPLIVIRKIIEFNKNKKEPTDPN